MRDKYDCLTCIAAMAFNITYEQARDGLGGNLDPAKPEPEESRRIQNAFYLLMEQCRCGVLHHLRPVPFVVGRRYWVGIKINDATNPLSVRLTHSIVVDEAGHVLDPNPDYGIFKSFPEWSPAMTLRHEEAFVSEIFEFTL